MYNIVSDKKQSRIYGRVYTKFNIRYKYEYEIYFTLQAMETMNNTYHAKSTI